MTEPEPPLADTIAIRTAFLRLLTSAPDGNTLVSALLRGALQRYKPVTGTLFVPDAGERNLVMIGAAGPVTLSAAAYRYCSLDVDLPTTRSYLTGQTLFLPQATWIEQFPALSYVVDAMDDAARASHLVMVSAPLLYQGVARGVVNFTLSQDRRWDYDDYTYFDGLLAAVSLWARIQDLTARLDAAGVTGSLPRVRAAGVTDRQRAILGLLSAGKSNEAIARTLGYSVSTVKNDLASLMSLLAARDRHEILERARAAGLIAEPGEDAGGSEVEPEMTPGDHPGLA